MNNIACQNPSCRSYGKPHPHCKCVAAMAEGGEMGSFCSDNRDHSPNCILFQNNSLKDADPSDSVGAFLLHHGIHGALKLNDKSFLDAYTVPVRKGHKSAEDRISVVFSKDKLPTGEDRSKHEVEVKEWLDKGGINHNLQEEIHSQHSPLKLAKGGKVAPQGERVLTQHPLEMALPEHNMHLQMAKSRVSNYLNTLRPDNISPRAPFNDDPDNTPAEKTYKKAVKMAVNPMSILDHVKKGTIDPDDVAHFKAMYPEANNLLQKKLTNKIVEHQLEKKTPNYKIRQGLSLLMGSTLSGELKPQNIQAAQATFTVRPQNTQQQEQSKKPKARSKNQLSKSDQAFLTGSQALAARQQKQ